MNTFGNKRHFPQTPGAAQRVVAAVIVGYNEKPLLPMCLESLLAIEHPRLLVIYVDNESTDGSLDFVRQTFPSVMAIASGGNLGYCGGNNVGIKRALEEGAEFILIQNPDTSVYDATYVARMLAYLDEHPAVGEVGPLVYLREPGQIQNTILNWPSIFDSIWSTVSRARIDGVGGRSAATRTATEVAVLNGCCFLVRSQTFREVGLYDSALWCYVDEVDWCWRAEQYGWKRHFLPVVSIVHHQKKDGYQRGSRTDYLMKRNTALWFLKTRRMGSMLTWMALTGAIAALRVATAPLQSRPISHPLAHLSMLTRGYAAVLRKVPKRLTSSQRVCDTLGDLDTAF